MAGCWAAGCGGQAEAADRSGGGASTAAGGATAGGARHLGGSSAGGAPVGVSGEGGGGVVPTAGAPGNALVCREQAPTLVYPLNPVQPVDFLGVFQKSSTAGEGPSGIQAFGPLCSGASSVDTCGVAFDELSPLTMFNKGEQFPVYQYFAYTRGDEVSTIGSTAELLSFLGAIDTPNEAAALLWAENLTVRCDKLVTVDDGYLAHTHYTVSDCPYTSQDIDVHVARDGSLTETAIGIPKSDGTCAGR